MYLVKVIDPAENRWYHHTNDVIDMEVCDTWVEAKATANAILPEEPTDYNLNDEDDYGMMSWYWGLQVTIEQI